MCKACHVRGDLIGDISLVQISDMYLCGQREWAGVHATITANAHIYLKLYALLAQRFYVTTMTYCDGLWLLLALLRKGCKRNPFITRLIVLANCLFLWK